MITCCRKQQPGGCQVPGTLQRITYRPCSMARAMQMDDTSTSLQAPCAPQQSNATSVQVVLDPVSTFMSVQKPRERSPLLRLPCTGQRAHAFTGSCSCVNQMPSSDPERHACMHQYPWCCQCYNATRGRKERERRWFRSPPPEEPSLPPGQAGFHAKIQLRV